MAQIKFKSNVYGTGTKDDPITCSDFDDFQFLLNNADTTTIYYKIVDGKYYYETTYIDASWNYFNIHFIALDPNAENKIFDCNEFSIGEHRLTNQGLRPINTLRTNFTIFGNNWVFKNFWWLSNRLEGFFNAGPTDSSGGRYDNLTITINKLHFLNCFHSGEGNHELLMFGDNYWDQTKATSIKWVFNDCKFSILTTGGTIYNITRTCSGMQPNDEFNRCSFNIICTSPDFHMHKYLTYYTNAVYSANKFTNCNFRINARYSSTLFNYGNLTTSGYPIYKFCKFTGEIRGDSSFNKGEIISGSSGSFESNISLIKDYMFLNCFWQLNFPDCKQNKAISDISIGIRNTDHSDNMASTTEFPDSTTNLKNTISLSKDDCLNANKLLENNFPVMTKIKTDSTEV
jgi:hypothetical protein